MRKKILTLLRLSLAWIFLWAFVDKVFGLGFATKTDQAWIRGVSPTAGFLSYGTHGPFAEIFKAMAGNPIIDWLFMAGLLGVGLGLATKIKLKFSAYCGIAMMTLIYLSMFPPTNNPFLDEHIIYILLLALIAKA
jgi:thiosulfate dehydrogenase [quinone] large subunit